MENLSKENVYVKVENGALAITFALILKGVGYKINSLNSYDEHSRNLMFDVEDNDFFYAPLSGNYTKKKQVSFGQLIDILMQPEKIAVRVDNEQEFNVLMNYYDSNGFVNIRGKNPKETVFLSTCWSFHDGFGHALASFFMSEGYKVIPFSDFAKEHNIKLPIITTVDGVDLFEGDEYQLVKKFHATGNIWKICRKNVKLSSTDFVLTDPCICKAFSTIESAEKWINDQNDVSINKSEGNSIRQIMQNAITVLMSHADGDFVSKDEAKNAGFDLHNLMISLPRMLILDDILNEVNRAESKHPNWPDDKLYAAAIVSEESGEMMKEAVKIQMNESDASLDNLRKETIQTAATCIRLLKNL